MNAALDQALAKIDKARQAAEPPRTAYVAPMDWKALAHKVPPARDWAEEHWLGMGHTTLLAGRGAIGKSVLTQTLLSTQALGRPYLGGETTQIRPRKCMIWATEDDQAELWRRQLAISEYLGVRLDAFADNLVIVPRLGEENTLLSVEYGRPLWTPEWSILQEMVNDLKVDILALDNVAQSISNEIDRHAVTKFCNAFSAIGRPSGLNTATLLLAHPAKGAGSEFSGSTAWENAVRMRWYMSDRLPDQKPDNDDAEPDDSVRYLAKRKSNYSAKDYVRLTFQEGVFVPSLPLNGRTFDSRYRADIAEAIVLKSMATLTRMGKQPTDGPSSPDYLPKLIMAFKLGENLGRKDVTDAMRNLMVAGKLRRDVVGEYANRSKKFGLVTV